ncbi:MAG: cation transporter, partial [Bacilli bacterium]
MKQTYIVHIDGQKADELKQLIDDRYQNNEVEFHENQLLISGDHVSISQIENTIRMIMNQMDSNSELIEEFNQNTYRKIVFLQGLDCGNCAAKIERIARRNLSHESLTVDFATSRLIIESKSEELKKTLLKDIQVIASSVDPRIKVTEKTQTNEEKVAFVRFTKWEVLSFIMGMLFFIGGILIKHVLPTVGIELPSIAFVGTFIVAYILLGWDVLYGAIRNIGSGRIFDEKFLMSLATVVAISIQYYEEAISV